MLGMVRRSASTVLSQVISFSLRSPERRDWTGAEAHEVTQAPWFHRPDLVRQEGLDSGPGPEQQE